MTEKKTKKPSIPTDKLIKRWTNKRDEFMADLAAGKLTRDHLRRLHESFSEDDGDPKQAAEVQALLKSTAKRNGVTQRLTTPDGRPIVRVGDADGLHFIRVTRKSFVPGTKYTFEEQAKQDLVELNPGDIVLRKYAGEVRGEAEDGEEGETGDGAMQAGPGAGEVEAAAAEGAAA